MTKRFLAFALMAALSLSFIMPESAMAQEAGNTVAAAANEPNEALEGRALSSYWRFCAKRLAFSKVRPIRFWPVWRYSSRFL